MVRISDVLNTLNAWKSEREEMAMVKSRTTCLSRAWVAMAAALFLAATGSAFAQESIDLGPIHLDNQNVVETDWGLSTAGEGNPFNNNNHVPGSGQGLSTDGNTLTNAIFREDSLFNLRVAPESANMIGMDNIEGFIHERFYSDVAPKIDHYLPDVNLMNYQRGYRGNGWSAYYGGHEYEFDAAEAYTDWRKGPLWLRLGKQYIVYGQELGLQTLDQVDSMNFARNPFNYSGLEFSDLREATWAARLTYDLGDMLAPIYLTSTRLTGFITQFEPSVVPAPGAYYNISLPAAFPLFNSDVNGHNGLVRAEHKPVYGAVIESDIAGIDWSANFYSTPEHFGVFHFNGLFAPNAFQGTPLIPGVPTPFVFGLTREFPREFIYGGMASYMIQPVYDFPGAIIINGDLIRLSATYTPNKAFAGDGTGASLPVKYKREGDMNIALDTEKDLRWSDKLPSAYILNEYNFRSRSAVFDTFMPAAPNRHHNFNLWVVSITQPLPMNRWSFNWTHLMDFNNGGSLYITPAVIYKPTSAQEYRLFWNFFTGTRNGSNYGGDKSQDAIIGEAIYKF